MLRLTVLVIFSIDVAFSGSYNIYRSACRKYAAFKVTDRNMKVKGGLISSYLVESLPDCVRNCLATSNCWTVNFSPRDSQGNCELLTSSRSSGGTLEAAPAWNHYESLSQDVTPGCQVTGVTPACDPGYECVDVCQTDKRFNCIDIDECASSPCINGGTCRNLVNRYQCICAPGYTGINCHLDINECASSPCYNGGGCNNYLNYYTCSCVNGYSGTRCETAPSTGGGDGGGGGWWTG